jgi:cytochrome c-type biogenesis protein CcmH/NrfG
VNAALTFSPGQVLVMAIVVLGLVLVTVWGIFEAEHDRVKRARDRQLRHEARHVRGEE